MSARRAEIRNSDSRKWNAKHLPGCLVEVFVIKSCIQSSISEIYVENSVAGVDKPSI
jgi:hypothetical protein